MLKLVKGLKELRIKSMLNNEFNKDAINEALAFLDKKEEELNDDIIPLENDIAALAKSESLTYLFTDEDLIFEKEDGTKFGKLTHCKNGVFENDSFIENKNFLKSIANQYKETQPKMKELKELKIMRNIVNGKFVFDAYIDEINFDRQSRPSLRKFNRGLRSLSEQIYQNTGLYRFSDYEHIEMFGTKDVDGQIETAIFYVPGNGWHTYSNNPKIKQREKEKIEENEDLLEKFSKLLSTKRDVLISLEIKYQRVVDMKKLRHKVINDLAPSLQEERKIVK